MRLGAPRARRGHTFWLQTRHEGRCWRPQREGWRGGDTSVTGDASSSRGHSGRPVGLGAELLLLSGAGRELPHHEERRPGFEREVSRLGRAQRPRRAVCKQESDQRPMVVSRSPGSALGPSEPVSLGPVPPFEMGIATHVQTGGASAGGAGNTQDIRVLDGAMGL